VHFNIKILSYKIEKAILNSLVSHAIKLFNTHSIELCSHKTVEFTLVIDKYDV